MYLFLLVEMALSALPTAVYEKGHFHETEIHRVAAAAENLHGRLPVSLIIPVIDSAFKELPVAFTSVASQTRLPYETIFIAAMPLRDGEISHDHLLFDLRSERHNCEHSILLGQDYDGLCPSNADQAAISQEPVYETILRHVGKSDHLRRNFRDPKIRRRLDRLLPSLATSIPRVPNLRMLLRVGATQYSAASNRMFASSLADENTQRFQYFDADDYMHPMTLAFCDQAFRKNPELQLLWFRYLDSNIGVFVRQSLRKLKHSGREICYDKSEWDCLIDIFKALLPIDDAQELLKQQETRKWQWETPYQLLWDGLPETEFEPFDTENTKYRWYLYKDYPFHRGKHFNSFHNALIVLEKNVLGDVPYPDIMSGEDALFVFRCLKRHVYANYLNSQLMLYMD